MLPACVSVCSRPVQLQETSQFSNLGITSVAKDRYVVTTQLRLLFIPCPSLRVAFVACGSWQLAAAAADGFLIASFNAGHLVPEISMSTRIERTQVSDRQGGTGLLERAGLCATF